LKEIPVDANSLMWEQDLVENSVVLAPVSCKMVVEDLDNIETMYMPPASSATSAFGPTVAMVSLKKLFCFSLSPAYCVVYISD
jgi:hypothetical protein